MREPGDPASLWEARDRGDPINNKWEVRGDTGRLMAVCDEEWVAKGIAEWANSHNFLVSALQTFVEASLGPAHDSAKRDAELHAAMMKGSDALRRAGYRRDTRLGWIKRRGPNCSECNGKGYLGCWPHGTCPACKGSGEEVASR